MRGAMSTITAVVLAAFVGYGAAWYFGAVEGNFSLLLFLASVVTGIYWLAERFYFLPQRYKAAAALEASAAGRKAELAKMGINQVDNKQPGRSQNPAHHAALVAGLDRRPLPGDRGGLPAALLPV
jgi:signal peptidase I